MSSQALITDPKQALTELLQKAGVTKVAYIDDKFSPDNLRDEFLGNLKAIKRETENVPELDFVDWSKPSNVFDSVIEKSWDEIKEPRLIYEYLQRIYSYRGDKDGIINILPVSKLKGIAPEYIETYTPEAWEKEKESFFSNYTKEENSKVLCLFDMELKSSTKNGIHYLIDTLSGNNKRNAYCAIFSHLVVVGSEFQKKKEWSSTFSLEDIQDKFYPISKATFYDEPEWGFIEGIKNVLIIEEVEKLKSHSIQIIKEAQQKTIQEVTEITPETYNQIIQRSSASEGVWEMNTLFRISNLIQDVSLKSSILSTEVRTIFNSSISVIRSFEEIKFDQESIIESKQAADLQEKEIFEKGDVINSLHYPLANGDVFLINDKEYILLSQPCNISLRPRGVRSNDYELATLVQIIGEDKGENSVRIKCQNKWVKFAANYSIKFDVLDLAVFNEDGICKINYMKDWDDEVLFHLPLIERFKKLKKQYENCAERIIDIEKILDKAGKKKQYLSLLNPIVTLNSKLKIPKAVFNKDENSFNFEIQRIKRLKEPYSNDILQKFMLYQSRNAFEHDIAKTS
jgi:hypothetical protein